MKLQLIVPILVLALIGAGSAEDDTKATAEVGNKATEEVGNRAASSVVNYNCQCDSLTFADKYGNIHGNCKRADSSGAVWCYLPLYVQSSCSDQHNQGHQSNRFPNKWSYEACATPSISSSYTGNLCARNNNNDNKAVEVNNKAASQQVNYGCQCDSLTFKDKNQNIHGNCKSSDHTGAAWCYLPLDTSSSCSDQGTSSRFPNLWSYEACATPSLSSSVSTPSMSSSVSTLDKAASNQVNYGCQCHHLTFKDRDGNVQGNCKSSDSTGARWCYLPLGCSTCSDQQSSRRFPNKWSYEACATPVYDYYDDNSINQRVHNDDDDDVDNHSEDTSKIKFIG